MAAPLAPAILFLLYLIISVGDTPAIGPIYQLGREGISRILSDDDGNIEDYLISVSEYPREAIREDVPIAADILAQFVEDGMVTQYHLR